MPSFSQLYDSIKGLPSPWNAIALWVIALVLAVVMFFRTVKIVHQDERAMKQRRGRIVRKKGEVCVYSPGIRGLIPFIDTLVRVSIRDHTYNLGTTNIKTGEYGVMDIDATVTLSVIDKEIYKIHFKNQDLERRTVALCLSLLRPVLYANKEELSAEELDVRTSIARDFAAAATPALASLGFISPVIEVTDVRPNAQALIAKAIAESGGHMPTPLE